MNTPLILKQILQMGNLIFLKKDNQRSITTLCSSTRRVWIVLFVLLSLISTAQGQSVGDYRSVASTNWSVLTTWQRCNSIGPAVWATPTALQGYPGENAGTGLVTIQNNTNVTLNVSPTNFIGSLLFANSANATTLTITGQTLNVTGAVTFGSPSANAGDQTLTIGTGRLNCASLTMPNTGAANQDLLLTISTGRMDISGDITMNGANDRNNITFSNNGTINVGGNFSGGGFTCSTSTVNYNGVGVQSIGSYTYYNLILSNTGTKTLLGAITTTSIAIQGSAILASDVYAITGNLAGTFTMAAGTGLTLGNTGSATAVAFPSNFVTGNISFNSTSSVTYQTNGAQNVSGVPNYANLTLATSGIKTMQAALTINNNLAITGSATLYTNTFQINGNATGTFTMAAGTGLTLGATGNGANILFPSNFTSGNITLDIASTVTYQSNAAQTVSNVPTYGNLTTATSGVKTCNGPLTVNGNLAVNGTSTLSMGTTASIWGIAGNATIDGSLDFGSTTVKTINLNGDLINASGTITMANEALAHQLNLNGANNAIGTFTTTGSNINVNYNRAGDQQVFASANYRYLNVLGGGTKTIQGAVTINNVLNLSNGILSLGGGASNLSIADGATITGSFDNTHMIECNGTGSLQKYSTTNAGFVMLYPVGTGSNYSPFEITSFSATIAANAYIQVRAVSGVAPTANSTDLNKHWILFTNNLLAPFLANAQFTYVDPDEIGPGGDQTKYSLNRYTGTVWAAPAGVSGAGSNPMSTTGTNVLTGTWTARETTRTLYSYQSGDWGTATNWTTDPSGTLSVTPAVPGIGDRVVILNGRTISTALARTVYSLQINEGGILDIGSIAGHNFGSVSGKGLLRLSTTTFPGGTFTSFVSSNGGTIEYYNVSGSLPLQDTYNNILFTNNTAINNTLVLTNPTDPTSYTVNGKFEITRIGSGTLIFTVANAARVINLDVKGNLNIGEGCSFLLGAFNATHNINLWGDFTNSGTVNLNRNADYAANTLGAAILTFWGSTDNTVTVNTTTRFWNFRANKGNDQTYILYVDGTNANCDPFKGRDPMVNSDQLGEFATISIFSGTVQLGENINVLQLSTSGGYDIGVDVDQEKAKLWIDGATVSEPGFIAIYGNLKISSGILNVNRIVIRYNGSIEINGGTINVTQIRPSVYTNSTPRGSYIQTGGILNVTGPSSNNDYPIFCWPHASTSFKMTGGEFNITGCTSAGNASTGGLLILSNSYEITGGVMNIYSATAGGVNFNINTTVPIWDINFYAQAAGNRTFSLNAQPNLIPNSPTTFLPNPLPARPLVVLNNLKIFTGNNPILNTFNQNVTVSKDFILEPSTTYTPGTNTTTFNGIGAQMFNAAGTITNYLQNVILTNSSDLSLINNDVLINGNLSIGSGCTFRDNGRIISVNGNITNSGVHFKPISGAGSIRLVGVANQTISGDGAGSFNNLYLDKTGGSTTLTANMTITGDLRLANTTARIFIGVNNLRFGPDGDVFDNLTGTGKAFSVNRMIQTNGLASDEGLSKTFNSTNAFVFPYGFYNAANTTYYYMPGSIQFSSAPTISYGTVTSTPVNMRHPLAQGTNNAINCYWKSSSIGFAGVPAASVRHIYSYDPTPTNYFVPVPANEALYIPGFYHSSTSAWSIINDINLVDQANNVISYDAANSADGEFTAGEPSAFTAIPVRYSSGVNGDWDNTATWSSVAVGGAGGASAPNANTIVIIGDATNNHTVTIGQTNRMAGSLFIATGSTLDLQQYQGHAFASLPDGGISGSGKLRIASSGYFPQADFGDFIGDSGGTVEYYTIAAVGNITIPTQSAGAALQLSNYKHLILSPSTGYNITLPDRDLTIYGDLTINGAGNGANDGARTRNAGTPRTYTINGNLYVNSGLFEYRNGVISTIKVLGNTNINGTAIFRVLNSAAVNNLLEMYGDLTVAAGATFNMFNGTGRVLSSFKGTNNAAINGTGTIGFYNLTVDKGTNPNPVLTLNSTITTGITNPFLTLLNGTFRVDGPTVEVTNAATNFSIPSTACLSVNSGEVRVAYSGNNNSDLLLTGKLEVLGGNMVIGNSANNTNNDIEYAAAGLPEIVVNGGQLFVNGQIRRSTATTSGSLIYRQAGGSTIINGRNQFANRAKFEIANTGSLFNTSGGTLTIVRNGGGNNYGDAYIRPDSSAVTGGTIQFGDNTSTTGLDFSFSTTIPLWNLNIGTATVEQNLDLTILPLTILNQLLIDGNSVFRANGFGVNFEGSLSNRNSSASGGIDQGGFQAGSTTQITTFNGSGAQSISGNGTNLTNFANLVISSGGTVTLAANSNIQVNKNLSLQTGTLASVGNNIYLLGNVDNSSTHTSTGVVNGIVFSGTSKQYISGNGLGHFGNVIINNSSGVDMLDNIQIDGRLTFTNGPIYIDDYLLTFGTNATVAGVFGTSRMIIFNGALSDRGVKKLFPATPSALFRFPVGVAGKYTPVTFTVTANSAVGSIVVSPVNSKHPATTDALINELSYYWYVRSTGFSGLQVTHTYSYLTSDVSPVEANYVCGSYNLASNTWTNLGAVVNAGTNTITLTDANYITGEYTAGEPSNFGTIIQLYSRNNRPTNNWNDPQSWTTNADGSDCADANCTAGHATNAPNGNPVTILAGHTIELNANSAVAYSINVIGTLDCRNTTFHSLGHVFGTGKIDITSTASGIFVFPGGEFDSFFDTPNTTLEFQGTSNATLPLKPGNVYKPYQNVIFSGTGIKYMSAENMKILGNMTIRSATVLSNALYNKTLYLLGNWTDENTTADGFIPGTGTVSFEGSTPQLLTLGRTEKFYNFIINNSAGVDLTPSSANTGIQISRFLYLTLGNIKSYSNKLVTLTNTSVSAIIGGSASSFVDGHLRKNITNGSYFYFPVGSGSRYARLYISGTTGGTGYWTGSYTNANPHPTYPTAIANLNSPITSVSDNEYWEISRPAPGATARIRLRWDANSYPAYTGDALLRSRLRVVEYEGGAVTKWSERGNIVSGNAIAGTVSTSANVTQNDYVFTLGIIGVSASIADLTAKSVCNNGEIASIPVNLTGTAPWTLNYRTTGGTTTNFTQTGILTSPYTIQLTGADIGGSTGSPYTLSLVSVSDASTVGVCNASTVSITIKETFTPDISNIAAVGSGETRSYSTAANAGSTYAWSWVGASGGSFNTASSNPTDITFNAGTGSFQLQLIETSASGCTSSDVQAIEVSLVPVPDISPTTANVCINSVVTYSTPNIVGNEYRWAVTNGTCTTLNYNTWRAGGNSISVTWDLTGSSSVTVEERIAAQPTVIGTDNNTYEVYPAPSDKVVTAVSSSICEGASTNISVIASESGISYQLRNNVGDVNIGTAVAGNGADINLPTGSLTTGSYTFNVLAYNLGCQLEVPTPPLPTVTVSALPTATIAGLVTGSAVCESDQVQISIVFTGTPPFAFTMVDGLGNTWSETGINALSGVAYTYNIPLIQSVWVSPLLPTVYTYSITSASDNSTCSATSISGSAVVNIYKVPITGPEYHVSNSKNL